MTVDWQTVIAVGIALFCSVWVLWRWSRPLFKKEGTGCSLCDECGERNDQSELVQITQLDKSSLN